MQPGRSAADFEQARLGVECGTLWEVLAGRLRTQASAFGQLDGERIAENKGKSV